MVEFIDPPGDIRFKIPRYESAEDGWQYFLACFRGGSIAHFEGNGTSFVNSASMSFFIGEG